MKRLIVLIISIALIASAFGGNVDKTRLVNHPAYPVLVDDPLPNGKPLPLENFPFSGGTDDPTQVGTTWYDFTNYGSLTKIIVRDNYGNIHFNWTNGLNTGASSRHVYYNFYNTSTGVWTYPQTGVACFSSYRSGFTCMDVMSDQRAMVCCHSQLLSSSLLMSTCGLDLIYGLGAFLSVSIPNPMISDSVYWPHAAVDINDVTYVFARKYPYENWTEGFYSYSDNMVTSFSQFSFSDTMNVPSFTVATSRVSARAAYGYHQFLGDYLNYGLWSGLLAGQVNNDAYIIRKEVGEEWNWANPFNITKILVGDVSFLPHDTLQARGDTLRAYLDIDLMFDNDDVLHAMFTTRGLWETPWDTAAALDGLTEAGFIWHWREDTDSLNVVANGWWVSWDSTGWGEGCGAWKSTICRPSMGIDEDGNIYCVYELYHDGWTEPDIAANGSANGDVYATVSTDGGYNWAEPTPITDTHSHMANPGSCMSEVFPCLAEIVDDSLHIFYMEDKDAGSWVFSEGISTQNPMWYHPVAKSDIATTPLITQFYYHIRPVPRQPYVGVSAGNLIAPSDLSLQANYPNPFNPSTKFNFSLKQTVFASLKVYDIEGRLVAKLAEGVYRPGEYSAVWDAGSSSSGIYFCQLSASGYTRTVKAILLK